MWNTLDISPNVPRWYEDQVKKSDCVIVLASHKMTRRCQNSLEEGDDRKYSVNRFDWFTVIQTTDVKCKKKMNKNEQSLFVERVAKVKSCSVPFSCFIGIVLSLSKLLDFEWLMPVQFKCNTSANYNPLQRFWKLVRRNPENPKLANILVQINPKLNLKPFSMG